MTTVSLFRCVVISLINPPHCKCFTSNILQTMSLSSLDSFSERLFIGGLIMNSLSLSFIIANIYSALLSLIPLCKLLFTQESVAERLQSPLASVREAFKSRKMQYKVSFKLIRHLLQSSLPLPSTSHPLSPAQDRQVWTRGSRSLPRPNIKDDVCFFIDCLGIRLERSI